MAPRRDTSDFTDQRGMILARAAELFALHGYRGASMNDIAKAAGLSKPTLYHYYVDKGAILVSIVEDHVTRLVDLVETVAAANLKGDEWLRTLIERFMDEYADAQNSHRVLTEDVRFLDRADRHRILQKERQVVQAFADAISAIRPDLANSALRKPVAMLLMGMLNWMFTWWKPNGELKHRTMAPIVFELFTRGLQSFDIPEPVAGDGAGPRGRKAAPARARSQG